MMKRITMKEIAKLVKSNNSTEDEEHIDLMQLALFKDKKLSKKEEDVIFKHLAHCSQCRDILITSNEIDIANNTTLKVANNFNYKESLKHFLPFAAVVVILIGVPQTDKFFNEESSMKNVVNERNIFQESIEYWEDLFSNFFKG